MSVNDYAAKIAKQREELHSGSVSSRQLTSETHKTGLLGEFEFGRFCGLMPNLEPKRNGDGGIDFHLPLVFTVDVKARKFREGELDLLVEVGEVNADIYVLAVLYEDCRMVLAGWEWGHVMAKQPPRDLGTGVVNHWKSSKKLRSMDELDVRRLTYSKRL